jgi:hypothetical protein
MDGRGITSPRGMPTRCHNTGILRYNAYHHYWNRDIIITQVPEGQKPEVVIHQIPIVGTDEPVYCVISFLSRPAVLPDALSMGNRPINGRSFPKFTNHLSRF